MDIFPGEWVGREDKEAEWKKKLNIGDRATVVVDSQFDDSDIRRIGQTGTVVDLDPIDEWAYQLEFQDGETNWFKRYILEKV